MLAAAIKFKDAFSRFADREPHYDICPSAEDWTKTEKVCSVLELFWTATHIVSGSDYPTSNLFLNEVSKVKVLLDKKSLENDIFIQDIVARMKKKFDKYWGDTNLLMSIAVALDPRYESIGEGQRNKLSNRDLANVETQSGWSEYAEYLKSVESIQPQKSELDLYLKENCYIFEKDKKNGKDFDVLEWWRVHALKYKILSIMTRDILAILITIVAFEATFSAGSRVIDKYRA
ncbi:UNVERIFIED_CONTAM: Zinc finger BED domain-containing protein RICESLEEPER 1 [Sesamum indicum]